MQLLFPSGLGEDASTGTGIYQGILAVLTSTGDEGQGWLEDDRWCGSGCLFLIVDVYMVHKSGVEDLDACP